MTSTIPIRRWSRAAIIVAAVLVGVAGASTTASADCADEQGQGQNGKKKNYKTIIGPDGKKTFVIEKAFVVCGKVPRPTVIYAFQASTIGYEWATLKKKFLPRIMKSVKDPVF